MHISELRVDQIIINNAIKVYELEQGLLRSIGQY